MLSAELFIVNSDVSTQKPPASAALLRQRTDSDEWMNFAFTAERSMFIAVSFKTLGKAQTCKVKFKTLDSAQTHHLFKTLGLCPNTPPPGQVLFAAQKAACGVRMSLRYLLKKVDENFNFKGFLLSNIVTVLCK